MGVTQEKGFNNASFARKSLAQRLLNYIILYARMEELLLYTRNIKYG